MFFPRFRHIPALVLFFGLLLNSRADSTVEVCTQENLRDALAEGGVVKLLQCDTNITLTSPIVIKVNTSLIATQEVVLSGGLLTRLFIVNPGVNFRLENITLFSGRQTETNAESAGIPQTAGAGIYNDGGNITIFKGRFQSHAVVGIIGQAGTATDRADGDDGENGGDAAGAAIFNNGGTITISNTVFEANSATAGPGGKGGDGDGIFGGDGGRGGDGGSAAGAAIYSQGGRVSLFNCVFTNNTAAGAIAGGAGVGTGALGFNGSPGEAGDGIGGAVAGSNAEILIYGCTFVNNQGKSADGANGNAGISSHDGDEGRNGGEALGGAVYSTGSLSVTNSTFVSNSVSSGKGGNGGDGGASFFGADGGKGGTGGTASGGAIESSGPASIVHCTFSENTVTAGAGGSGGNGSAPLGENGDSGSAGARLGSAVNQSIATLNIANTILANIANSGVPSLAGVINDLGGNSTTDSTSLLNSPLSSKRTNPRLVALASNGGPTPTMALATNSPVIDKALSQFCVPFDQRGTNRAGTCDIGAFELTTNANTGPIIPTNSLSLRATSVLTNNQISLTWPTGFANLFLQSSTDLGMTNAWTTVTNGGLVQNSNFVFTVTTTNAGFPLRFFRLNGTNSTTTSGPPAPPG